VDELDALKKAHEEQAVELDAHRRDLTIARSDLNLVDKDQLDILASLRASVNEDKTGLEKEIRDMRKTERELREKNRMQLEQINALLLEKVDMQGEGIGQREAMLKRERDVADLRASLNGKDLPEEAKARLLSLHEDNINLKEQVKTEKQKGQVARSFIKEQDAIIKRLQDERADGGNFSEAEESYKARFKELEDKIEELQGLFAEQERSFNREKERMAQMVQAMSQVRSQPQLRQGRAKLEPKSWLAMQREQMSASMLRRDR